MIGTGEQPELLLSNNGEMFFRPTCVHSSVSRGYEVRNVGRSACYFKWVILKEDGTHLSVHPVEGIFLPNQTQEHQWTFAPTEQKKHVFKATCLVWPADAQEEKPKSLPPKQAQKYKLRIVAEATVGEVRTEKYKIELGSVIAGSSKGELLSFYNDSHTDLHVRFFVKQAIDSQYGENPDEMEPMGLKLNMVLTTVPARSKIDVVATARPYRRVFYTWYIYYQLQSADGEPIHSAKKSLLCEINAEGVYPTLAVIDARPSGTGAIISKTQLWRWFSIDNLNSCLDSDPDKAELRYTLATRHSATRRPSTYTKSIMDFNFGAAGVGSEPCYVSVMVKNTGSVPTQWSFLFPKDLELEIDYWAETGLFDPDELHELHVQDNKLFEVCPKKGVLNPGEHRTLLFIYKHDIPGTHRVPVLLKIENGKEILLNFVGVTVEPDRRYLHFPGTKHVFTPVPIGELTPPKQLYEMFNGGSMSVLYEVDLSPLLLLETENFNHPILTCLNPSGEIAPGMSSNLEWVFSPLESKTYTIDVPIHIVGGETALITFKGIGYDSRVMGGSMPSLDQPPEFTSVPGTQKVAVPGQTLFLSEERISFGNLPLFGKARHVIFLTNQSDNRPLTYSWHATSSVVNEVLSIEPIQGHLKPGQSTMVKIVFCASGQPSFYDLDLVCEIVDEVSVAEYYAELKAWKEERDRQAVEFEITGDVDDAQPSAVRDTPFEVYSGPAKYELSSPKRNLDNILNKSQTPLRLTDSDMYKSVTKSEFKTFKTLPPIRFEDPVKAPSNRSRLVRHQEASAKHEWLRPQPPSPSIAHLGVTARTHDIAQFRLHFSGASDKHFIDRTMQIDNPVVPKTSGQTQYPLTTCSGTEKKMVVSIMSDVIRGLLDDPTFHSAAKELEKEETPYFGQLPKDGESKDVESSEQTNGRTSKPTSDHQTVLTPSALEEKAGSVETRETPALQLMSDMLDQNEPDVWNSQTLEGIDSEAIKRSASFGTILEDVISSTITNIMEEAMNGEVLLTVRPRVVALPPSRNASSSSCKPLSENNLQKSATSKSETVRDTQSPKKSCGSSIAGSTN